MSDHITWEMNGPHSRACGIRVHPHGVECNKNCQTCHGLSPQDFDKMQRMDPSTSSVHSTMLTTMQALDVAVAAMDSEDEGIRLSAAQTILRYSRFVRPNDESQALP